ncbi:MAG: acetolactate synthase [Phycisphaerales bacterium]
MTQMPTPTPTAKGYAPAGVTQFSVFLENRVGKMLELVKAFDDAMVRICAMSVNDSSDHAVLRIVTSNTAGTRQLLTRQDLSFIELEILVVCLDAEHSLSRMCQFLLGAELNIRFTYPLMGWAAATCPTIALAVDDLTLAAQILRRKEFRLLGEADLPKWEE